MYSYSSKTISKDGKLQKSRNGDADTTAGGTTSVQPSSAALTRRNPQLTANQAISACGGVNPLLSRLRSEGLRAGVPYSLASAQSTLPYLIPATAAQGSADADSKEMDENQKSARLHASVSASASAAGAEAARTYPSANSRTSSHNHTAVTTAAASSPRGNGASQRISPSSGPRPPPPRTAPSGLQVYEQPVYTVKDLRSYISANTASAAANPNAAQSSYVSRRLANTSKMLTNGEDTTTGGGFIPGTAIPLFPTVPSNSPKGFTYLAPQPRNTLDHFNPYDLRVVSHAELDQTNYYTVSAAGVTRYTKNEAEFVNIKTWEREYGIFHQLITMDVFQHFKQWRSFFVWRKLVRSTSMQSCATFLNENLFYVHPTLSTTLQRIRSMCMQFSESNTLYNPATESRTLEQFCRAVHTHLNVQRGRLDKLIRDIRGEMDHACKATMAAAVMKREAALEAFTNELKRKSKLTDLIGRPEDRKPSYIEQSYKRAVCARLTAFIRLCDYVVVYTLINLASKAIVDLRKDLERVKKSEAQHGAHGKRGDEEGSERQRSRKASVNPNASDTNAARRASMPRNARMGAQASERGGAQNSSDQCILQVDVVYNTEAGAIEVVPSCQHTSEAIEDIIKDYVKTVGDVPRFIGMETFSGYVNGSKEASKEESAGGPDVRDMILSEDSFLSDVAAIRSNLSTAFRTLEAYAAHFNTFGAMYRENAQLDAQRMRQTQSSVEFYREQLAMYKAQMESVQTTIPNSKEVALFHVRTEALREFFVPSPVACLDTIHDLLPSIAHDENEALLADLQTCNSYLSNTTKSVESYVDLLEFHKKTEARFEAISVRYEFIRGLFTLLQDEKVHPADEDEETFRSGTRPQFEKLRSLLQVLDDGKESQQRHFARVIDDQLEALKYRIEEIGDRAGQAIISDDTTPVDEAIAYVDNLLREAQEVADREGQLRTFQEQIGIEETPVESLVTMMNDVKLKERLWTSTREWEELSQTYSTQPFAALDLAPLQDNIQKYMTVVKQVTSKLPKNLAAAALRENVDHWRQVAPILTALKNPKLKHEHTARISSIIGPIQDDDGNMHTIAEMERTYSIGMLMRSDVLQFREDILAVSIAATEEDKLQQGIDKVNAMWNGGGLKPAMELQFMNHKDKKDAYVLSGSTIEDVTALLEDSSIAISTLGSSKHCQGVLRVQVERWERRLQYMGETLEVWVEFQKNWMYLENIFSSSEIRNQWKDDAKRFEKADRFFRDLTRLARDMPSAFRALLINAPPFEADDDVNASRSLKSDFENYIKELEKVLASLERKLEEKRRAFPRFYFLSNDDLLDILAKVKTPQLIMTHMLKMFDGIKTLQFTDTNDITHMVSMEGENVELTNKTIKARGAVEVWIDSLEQEMFVTLRKLAKNCFDGYESTPEGRRQWMFSHPSQLVLIMEQIMWTRTVEDALDHDNSQTLMANLRDANYKQLEELARMTSLKLSKVQRSLLSTLITIDVHGRDLVSEMCESGVLQSSEFGWTKQMRAYWEKDEDGYGNVFIRQNNSCFKYGYEYLGAQGRLVITPLTDRIYMTVTGALKLYLGAAPAGPAGTGKTETVKDLAKNMARQCIVYNCSDGVTYKMMEKFFSGLIQTGAWTCLDEFNRINVEVLSVIASQVLEIKMALQSGAQTFTFQGTPNVRVRPTYGAFITMNPGYAGRTELPDNLKILFRPVAVMTPDFRMIAEVILYSEGYTSAKELSLKITQLYKLSSEQLSPQDHYDFGMRALKSILVMAGDLKRSQPDVSEDLTLIVACNNSNVPKFVAEDIPLFHGIMQDLFPGAKFPEKKYDELQPAMEAYLGTKQLVAQETWLKKGIQFYETLVVRHGVMLVGVTGTGKTEARDCIAAALTTMAENGSTDPVARPVVQFVMNPKAISMHELYGRLDVNTNEWRDGVLAVIAKNCTRESDSSTDHRWIVFDGPVDTLWIESLNSVLDDSKLLCLDSGERIKLPDTIHMLFEVADLSVASPATVSRCGMVYMDADDLHWRSVMRHWANTKLAETSAQPLCREYIVGLFETHMQKALDWYATQNVLINAGPMNIVQSVCDLFAATLVANDVQLPPDSDGDGSSAAQRQGGRRASRRTSTTLNGSHSMNEASFHERNEICNLVFVFSVIWTVGGNVDLATQDLFDAFARSQYETMVRFPNAGSVFDYTIDFSSRLFTSWEGKVKSYEYDPNTAFFNILVPTVDTVRLSTIAETLIKYGKPLLFNGPTGVGKSVILADCLNAKKEELKLSVAQFQFSSQTSSERTQELIESKLKHKRKNLLGAPPGFRVVLFIDDLNMPALEVFGASPPIELLRQMMGYDGFYDRKVAGFWKSIEDVMVVGACGPPEGGRNPMTPRLTRLFHLLQVPTLNDESMKRIFVPILQGYFQSKGFASDVKDLCKNMVTASVEVFSKIRADLRPRHSTPHYTFNLRDLAKVCQGIMQASPRVCKDGNSALRLWVHENMRCFYDRLTSVEDRTYFTEEVMMDSIRRLLANSATHEELFERDPIVWGDFLRIGAAERVYDEVHDFSSLSTLYDEYQDDYNSKAVAVKEGETQSVGGGLNLVFFKDHCEHLARIIRIIRQPRGNALLVGVGGSGKQSLTRLAASIAECRRFELSVGKGFTIADFHEFLLELYTVAGVQCTPSVFLISDAQIVDNTMLEDINGLLNSGEVPSMFTPEEREKRISACAEAAKEVGITQRDEIFSFFISRVRDNMHVVLCMSPVGDSFRARCRQFPSLTNCCTIDWFDGWPREALFGVAKRVMADEEQQTRASHVDHAAAAAAAAGKSESQHRPSESNAKAGGKGHVRFSVADQGRRRSTGEHIAGARRRSNGSVSEVVGGGPRMMEVLTELCVDVHQAVVQVAQEYWDELRRRYYITPISFLEFIKLYKSMLVSKRDEAVAQVTQLRNGRTKMKETDETIAVMKKEIEEKRPQLEQASKDTQMVVADLAVRQASAQEVQVRVKAQQESALVQQKQASEIAAEANAKLAEAKPIIDRAKAALDTIQASDLNELRSLANPPSAVLKTAQACMVMFDHKDFNGAWSGNTDWKGAREFLSYRALLDMIRNYPTDNVKPSVLQKVSKFINDEEFTVEICSAKGSMTCGSLCAWVHAVNDYSKVVKEVAPMREAAGEAEKNLAEMNEKLSIARSELKRVQDELTELQQTYETSLKRKNDLEHGLVLCISRLENAETLSGCLKSESVRWEKSIETLQAQLDQLPITTFLASACIAYFGAFTPAFRRRLVALWIEKLQSRGFDAHSFTLSSAMGDPVEILNWQINGLPTDESSTESAIIASMSCAPWRWPLLIDPQEQGIKWLKKQFDGSSDSSTGASDAAAPTQKQPGGRVTSAPNDAAKKSAKSTLKIIRLSDPTWMRTLEMQVRLGGTVVLDDVGETLDAALEPLLQRSILTSDNGEQQIQLTPQSGLIDYNPNFRFFMCTKLPNPCYLPDISTKITLLNFTVTMDGLTEQMLGEVVSVEKRELEEEKNRIVNSISLGKKKLKAIEAAILEKLQNSKGNILDDKELISELKSAQTSAVELGEQQTEAEEKMQTITVARNEYRDVAARSAVLFFVLADLARIDPMYQYSLQYFQRVVRSVLETTKKPTTESVRALLEEKRKAGGASAEGNTVVEAGGGGGTVAVVTEADLRAAHLDNLMERLSETTYTQVCRGLFNKDKMILSLLISAAIDLSLKRIADQEWQYFVRAPALVPSELPDQPPDLQWLTRPQYELMAALERVVPCFEGLVEDVLERQELWKKFVFSENPQDEPLPGGASPSTSDVAQLAAEAEDINWQAELTPFQKTLVVRCFREEKLFFAVRNYVRDAMGEMYTEAPPFNLEGALADSAPQTPIVFILSQGVDPMEMLQACAASNEQELQYISLGQGQGDNAKKLIEKCRKSGSWALLQNCHLSKTFMGDLATQVGMLAQNRPDTHPNFRLWLTSMPTDFFPVFVLQTSVKLTTEPPTGLRANMLRCFDSLAPEDVEVFPSTEVFTDGMTKETAFKKLLYSLCFFHAVVLERKKYGPLGWNVRYEWNDTDFHASRQWLQLFLAEQNQIPWESLEYVIGQINYGGRVTDPLDRFTLETILRSYLRVDVLSDGYSFSASGQYRSPPIGDLASMKAFIGEISPIDDPEVFGMGENANLRYQLQVSHSLLGTVLSIQPRLVSSSGGGPSPEELVRQKCQDFDASLPPNITREEAGPTSFTVMANGLPNSMSTVLTHEVAKYNRLLDVIRTSLSDLQKALHGLTVLSADLDRMYDAFLNDQVPDLWQAVSYASLKPLGAWYRNFLERVAFIRAWVRKGEPTTFWMSGFFNPSAFMTGCFQAFARTELVSVDKLGFSFSILEDDVDAIVAAPARGYYVHGIFADSWRWDKERRVMAEALPGEPYTVLPVVHFLPEPFHKMPATSHSLPLYRTTKRAGVISSLGASSNYVLSVEVPSDRGSDFWRLVGAACVCSLDN